MGEPIGDMSRRGRDGLAMYHGGGKDSPDPPDYSQMAAASEKAAQLGADLGNKQLAESKRQYELNYATTKPVVDAQLDLMAQTKRQGDDYYNYSRSIRPAERAMMADAFGLSAGGLSSYQSKLNAVDAARGKEAFTANQQKQLADQQAAQQRSAQAQRDELNAQRTSLATTYANDLARLPQATTQQGVDTYGNPISVASTQVDPARAALDQNYKTQLAALDQRLSGLASAAAPKTAAGYKLPGSQIVGNKFFSNGVGYTVRTAEDGSATLLNSAGTVIGNVDARGRVTNSKNAAITNAYLNTRNSGGEIGGQLGAYKDNQYFANGQAYYLDESADGRVTLYNAAGKPAASYTTDKKGNPIFTGNAKLLQQAISDRAYKAPQAQLSGNTATVGGKSYSVSQTQAGTNILDANGQVIASIDAAGKVTGDQTIGTAVAGQMQEYTGQPDSVRLQNEADDYAATQLMEANAAQRAKEQGIVDEQALLDAQGRAGIQAAQQGLRSTVEASDTDIYGRDAKNIENMVGTALADSRAGYANSLNQALRQGMRYGYSPAKLAAMGGASATANASQQAAAANSTRQNQINATRGRFTQGAELGLNAATANQGLRQADFARNRGYNTQDKAINWAKQLDSVGMSRGMPGFSQGAYSLANQSGNSAVQNQMQPGQALLGGMAQGAQMQQTGMGQNIQGLSGILSSQTSLARQDDSGGGLLGAGLGLAGQLGAAWIKSSDRRLKESVALVGKDERTGLRLYEFNYIDDDTRYRGVMADEVEAVMPDAVVYDDMGFASVDYGMLGIEMVEVQS